MSIDPNEKIPSLAEQQATIAEYYRARTNIAECELETLERLLEQFEKEDLREVDFKVLMRGGLKHAAARRMELDELGVDEYFQRLRNRL